MPWTAAKPGRVAIIGIGSNSTRLLLADANEEAPGGFSVLVRKETVTRLAGYTTASGANLLHHNAILDTLAAASNFAEYARGQSATLTAILATEAVRAAHNPHELTGPIQQQLGVPVTVISGDEEARLGWRAVALDYDQSDALLGVIDIGGGSTDLSVGHAGSDRPGALTSIKVGARTATRRFDLHRPVDPSKLWGILSTLSIELSPQLSALQATPQVAIVIGGTATVLAAMRQALEEPASAGQGAAIERLWLAKRLALISRLDVEARVAQSVPADRADIIVAGGAILLSLLDAWGLSHFYVSQRTILDGFMVEL